MRLIFTMVLLISAISSFSQSWDEIIKVVSSHRDSADWFGYSVSIDGNKAIVGSYLDDDDLSGGNNLENAGSVYIFELSEGVWVESAKLVPSDRNANDRFGCRVGISGNVVVVGAFLEDEDASGGATMTDAGAAYIFELSGGVWTEKAKLVASDRAAGDRFGFGVSISGNRAIIGAYKESHNGANGNNASEAGAAYIFESIGGIWTETAKLTASDAGPVNWFGYSLSIDGNKAVVGAYRKSENSVSAAGAGAAYVYELSGGIWSETTKLLASDIGSQDRFGWSVSINGNRILVGATQNDDDVSGGNNLSNAGAAYVFDLNGGTWSETAKLVASDRATLDQFGSSVAISGDKLVVGAAFENENSTGGAPLTEAGSAYVFEWNGNSWTETAKLVASDRGAEDRFAFGIAMNGNHILVGSVFEDEDVSGGMSLDNAGSAYFFYKCSAGNTNIQFSGNTLSTSISGASYQWLNCDNGNIIPSETSQTFTPTSNGNYAVITSIGACVDTSICANVNSLGLKNSITEEELKIYPNPATDNLMLEGLKGDEVYQILNGLGEIVQQGVVNKTASIDVKLLDRGIYFLKFRYRPVIKFIKV